VLEITLATADQTLERCPNVQWVHFKVHKSRILKFMNLTASGPLISRPSDGSKAHTYTCKYAGS